ncbi:hypothetical protein SAMN02745753_00637 [Marinomonas polaris DSM 16579]|uniref:Asparagine synthase n=1 Tax=Marinomonas polaris DSM 16579 TaxID=1122206 RepID=A0A1M4VEM3_9GAMM|nr:hypothetical protein [Marinomonas polaris]SHE67358.1 hypothetical protein SAMN02745753_00637 [Marinomonas polaris DSM 16579]
MHFRLEINNEGDCKFDVIPNNSIPDLKLELYPNGDIEVRSDKRKVLILKILAKKIIHVNHHCDCQIFLKIEKNLNYVLSSNLDSLLSRYAIFNDDYIIKYILGGSLPSFDSAFKGINFLPPGTKIDVRNKIFEIENYFTENNSNFIDTLDDFISKKLQNFSKVAIEYSGGLESSILLQSVKSSGYCGEIELIHATDSDSGEADDLARVRRLAEYNKVGLTVIDQQDTPPFCTEVNPFCYSNFPHSGLVNQGYINTVAKKILSKNTLVLNGSGGDSLFRSLPQSWLHLELLHSGMPISSLKWLLKSSSYFRKSLITTIRHSLLKYENVKKMCENPGVHFSNNSIEEGFFDARSIPVDLSFPYLLYSDDISKQERHIDALVNKHEIISSPLAVFPGAYHSPFLQYESINSALSIESEKLLFNRINRYELRYQASKKYKSEEFWNTRKGNFTGLTQRSIKSNRNRIEEIILEGEFGKYVNPNRIRETLTAVSSGVKICPGYIINLYTVNLFACQWRLKLND